MNRKILEYETKTQSALQYQYFKDIHAGLIKYGTHAVTGSAIKVEYLQYIRSKED